MSAYMRRTSGVYQKDIDENMEHRVTAEVGEDCVEGGRSNILIIAAGQHFSGFSEGAERPNPFETSMEQHHFCDGLTYSPAHMPRICDSGV